MITIQSFKLKIVKTDEDFKDIEKSNDVYVVYIGDFVLKGESEPSLKVIEEFLEKSSKKYEEERRIFEKNRELFTRKLEFKENSRISKSERRRILSEKRARIYVFTVYDKARNLEEVKRIGGSSDRQGLRGTINFYTGGMSGKPGKPRFITNALIKMSLMLGNRVRVYTILLPSINIKVKTLFKGEEMQLTQINYKEYETKILEEYKDLHPNKEYPEWNFKEGGKEYPRELEILYGLYLLAKRLGLLKS